jgi:hypothetical protein
MDELVAETLRNVGFGDAFFAWPAGAAKRFDELVRAGTGRDPEGTARFLVWLRAETPMRYPALVGAAAFVSERLARGEHGLSRQLISGVLRRADDPGQLLAYWLSVHGALPKPVKRGVADAVARLYDQEAAEQYDTDAYHVEAPRFTGMAMALRGGVRTPKPLRFWDVIALTHPAVPYQEVFRSPKRRLGRRELRTLDRPAWDRLIAAMPVPDLLANLRLFDEASIPFETAMTVAARIADRNEVKGTRPMRFVAAWNAISSSRWRPALATGAAHSAHDIPEIPGSTLVMIAPDTAEGAAFGLVLAQRCVRAQVQSTRGEPFELAQGESPLHALIRWQATNSGRDPERQYEAVRQQDHDRVVFISTEVSDAADAEVTVPMYLWQTENPRWLAEDDEPAPDKHVFYGVSDAAFDAIPVMEGARPWER